MILCLIVSVYDVEQKENEMRLLKKQRDTVQYENNILQTRIVSLKSGSKSAEVLRYIFCDTLSYIVSGHGIIIAGFMWQCLNIYFKFACWQK